MTDSSDPVFHTTRWTVVLQVRGGPDDSEAALEALCQRYWYPLYAFVRRSGQGPEEAKDLTQEFFARLLEKRWLDAADRERGKFRTFLMMAMKRFLANEWDKEKAIKRGGGITHLSLDADLAEQRYAAEPEGPDSMGGDEVARLYDRRWAMTLLERTMERLEAEEPAERFAALKPCLTAGRGEFDCGEAARTLGMPDGAARVAVHRFRKRYRELFREEIAQTVAEGEDVDEEVRYLVGILAGG